MASWRFEPVLLLVLVATAWVYLRGFRELARERSDRLPPARAWSFVSGLAISYLALASPLDAFAGMLLSVHMTQHFLLMMVAPPLLWLGAPALPLLHGLPEVIRRDGLGPFFGWPLLHRLQSFLTHPVTCWSTFVGATWLWHVPALYQTALLDPFWHEVEHATFFLSGLLFWFPVVQPWPSRPRWSRWMMVPYLALASLQATIFSALLVFSDRIVYPIYATVPRLSGLSALDDQKVAGAVMWVPGSFVLLVAAMVLVAVLLTPALRRPGTPRHDLVRPSARRPTDALRWPVIGSLILHRRWIQVVLFAAAVAVVADGLFGPKVAAMNLAGVLPWTYWRAFAVIGLLALGNVFCMTCPFLLPRALGRRLLPAKRAWPAPLRSKWVAVGLFALYLWAYEVFALWDRPGATAWVIVGYFVAATLVDGWFKGASFCKYVCPIGQFNFVGSALSPFEVRPRSSKVCASCTTRDCLRGREGAPGCELELLLPAKVGNLDCTFCMDCVRACPHDNVGLLPRPPARELIGDPSRSSLGRLGGRLDVAALALVVVFGGFVNAAGMVEPLVRVLARAARLAGVESVALPYSAFALLGVIGVPVALCSGLGWWASRLPWLRLGGRPFACRLALALIPLGVAMWAVHLVFHLAHGAGAALPVMTRALADLGATTRAPDWASAHVMGPSGDGLISLRILLLDLGLLATFYLGWRVVRPATASIAQATVALAPWATVASGLFVAGIWILFQPMEMRGMLMP